MAKRGAAKQKICDAVLDLLSERSEGPNKKLSVSEIVKQAGVNRSTYYYYFYDPKEVVQCIIDAFVHDLSAEYNLMSPLECTTQTPSEQFNLEPFTTWFYQYCYDQKHIIASLIGSEYSSLFEKQLLNGLNAIFHAYTITFRDTRTGENVVLSSGLLFELYVNMHCYSTIGMIYAWANSGFTETPQSMIEASMEISNLRALSYHRKRTIGQ